MKYPLYFLIFSASDTYEITLKIWKSAVKEYVIFLFFMWTLIFKMKHKAQRYLLFSIDPPIPTVLGDPKRGWILLNIWE